MTATSSHIYELLPPNQVALVNQFCDRFEHAWRQGDTPAISDYLSTAPDSVRKVLLHELVLIDATYRKQASAEFDASSSYQQFPELDQSWLEQNIPAAGTPCPNDDSDSDPPESSRYEIIGEVGRGGMGIVYQARDRRLGRTVCLKSLHPQRNRNPQRLARFRREARVVSSLNHPNICTIYELEEHQDGAFLVLEWIVGVTFRELAAQEDDPRRVTDLVAQVAKALDAAHAAGVVHRDIKPENLMVRDDGLVKVLDFSLARLIDSEQLSASLDDDKTTEGAILGTAKYMSPEQARGEPAIAPSDVFSLGIVLYELATGQHPFPGSYLAAILNAIVQDDPEPASTVNPDLAPHLAQLIRRMLEKRPEDRPTAAEVHALLEDANTVAEDREPRFAQADAVTSHDQPSPGVSQQRHRLNLAVPIGLVCLAVLGVLLAMLKGNRAAVAPAPPRAVAPFDAKQAQLHQQEWADYLDLPVRIENSIGMRFVLIPAGEFEMGPAEPLEPLDLPEDDWRYVEPELQVAQHEPKHRVVLSNAYYFGETEVTYDQFKRFADESGYKTDAERTTGWGKEDGGWLLRQGYSWRNTGQWVCSDQHPVMNVNWNDATALCRWLTNNDPLGSYRLPAEAEWEFACRAGTTTTYYFGDDMNQLPQHAWFKDNFEVAYSRVGLKKPNPFGLYDLYGNRQEWCQDSFADDFYSRSPLSDPICRSAGETRVLRGGTHTDLAEFCSSARRWSQSRDFVGGAGIRVVCIPK